MKSERAMLQAVVKAVRHYIESGENDPQLLLDVKFRIEDLDNAGFGWGTYTPASIKRIEASQSEKKEAGE